jgi:hypothetical protein
VEQGNNDNKSKRCNGDNINFRDENNDKQHNSIATWNNDNIMRRPLTKIDVTPSGWLLNLNIVKNIFMVMGDDGKMLRDVTRS